MNLIKTALDPVSMYAIRTIAQVPNILSPPWVSSVFPVDYMNSAFKQLTTKAFAYSPLVTRSRLTERHTQNLRTWRSVVKVNKSESKSMSKDM